MARAHNFQLSWPGRFIVPVGLAAAALSLIAGEARAGCFVPGKGGTTLAPFLNAPARVPSPAPFKQPGVERAQEPATIVGLWYVEYTATYSTSGPLPIPVVPPGSFPFNQSFKTWHSDGTEWENAFLPPTGGNICMGVWKHTANASVKLHHTGVMWGPDGTMAAIFTEDEIVRVAPDGMTYSGSWDFKIHAPTDVLGTGTVLQEISGTVAATRITVQ
jgi:hypothetical protein